MEDERKKEQERIILNLKDMPENNNIVDMSEYYFLNDTFDIEDLFKNKNINNYKIDMSLLDLKRFIHGTIEVYTLSIQTITSKIYNSLSDYLNFNNINIDNSFNEFSLISEILTSYKNLSLIAGGLKNLLDIINYENTCLELYNNNNINNYYKFEDINLYKMISNNETYHSIYFILKDNVPNDKVKERIGNYF